MGRSNDAYFKIIKLICNLLLYFEGEISLLHSRIAERGVNLQTEEKIELWKRQTDAEIQRLHSKFQQHRDEELNSSATSSSVVFKELGHM